MCWTPLYEIPNAVEKKLSKSHGVSGVIGGRNKTKQKNRYVMAKV